MARAYVLHSATTKTKRLFSGFSAAVIALTGLSGALPLVFSGNAAAATHTADVCAADCDYTTIQEALDSVAENTTITVKNGTYTGTAKFKKNGTTLVGETKSGVIINAMDTAGQAGIMIEGVNNATLKNVTVRPGENLVKGALIKLTNGTQGLVENVDAKASTAVMVTGIDVNSYSNVTLRNIYVNGVGKDGVSVSSNYGGNTAYTSNNISMNHVTVANASWSGFAFYTNSGGATTSISGLNMNNIRAQYNTRGVYFEGLTGGTITGASGQPVKLGAANFKNSTEYFIVNGQSAGVNATATLFDDTLGSEMNAGQQNAVGQKIYDRQDNPQLGHVQFDATVPTLSSVTFNGNDLDGAHLTGTQTVVANIDDNAVNFTNFELRQNGLLKAQWQGQPAGSNTPSATIDTAQYPEGNYDLHVYGRDQAGSTFNELIPFTIDNTNPTLKVNKNRAAYLESGATVNSASKPEIEAFDKNLSKIEITKQDGTFVTAWTNVAQNSTTRKGISWLGQGSYVIRAFDKAGLVSDAFSINIDNTSPTGTVQYSNTEPTNSDVTAYLQTSEAVGTPLGWIATGTSGQEFTKNYPTNTTETVSFNDIAGNGGSTPITITWIDKTAPTGTFMYSNKNGAQVTKEDVTVTLTASESIQQPTGWEMVSENVYKKIHSVNGKYSVVVTDLANNPTTLKYEVKRIDRTNPVIEGVENEQTYLTPVDYIVTEQSLAKVTVNGKTVTMTDLGGGKHAGPAITTPGHYTIQATDKAGNVTEVTFMITSLVSLDPITETPEKEAPVGEGNDTPTPSLVAPAGNAPIVLTPSTTQAQAAPVTSQPVASTTTADVADDDGEVLGASTTATPAADTGSDDGEVKAATTTTDEKKIENSSNNFLGLGWWWLPVILAAIVVVLTVGRRINSNEAK